MEKEKERRELRRVNNMSEKSSEEERSGQVNPRLWMGGTFIHPFRNHFNTKLNLKKPAGLMKERNLAAEQRESTAAEKRRLRSGSHPFSQVAG